NSVGSGTTYSDSGTLQVSGTIGNTTVKNGGLLDGTGTIGALAVESGGTLAPGNSPGTITTGNLDLQTGSTLAIEIQGGSPGVGGFDQVVVNGSVTLGGTLSALISGFTPVSGESFEIIDNDGSDLVNGTFANLAEGATFTQGGITYSISYIGGTGNDVILTEVNGAPTLSGVPATVNFTEGQTVTLAPAAVVADSDNFTLANATVKITGGTFAGDGDVLGFSTAGTSITASYNSTTETLILTGADTVAH